MGHGGNESGARELMNMTVLRRGIRLVDRHVGALPGRRVLGAGKPGPG
jgi:hypothetical protein